MNRLRTAIETAGWGIFCASSWTWCIGMFLPVILLGRFGWWGFLAFAVPNVLGCAAFGYVVRDRECSRDLTVMHRPMMRLFSLITIAYHVFFLSFICWLLLPISDGGEQMLWIAMIAPAAMIFLALLLADVPERHWPRFGAMVYGVSLVVFALIGFEPLGQIDWSGEHPVGDVAWLLPVMAFGFGLCPYLDLTFHRALQRSPSRHAFAVFGVTFAVMIVLTCTYWDALANGFTWLVLAHIAAQSVFTISAHLREAQLTLAGPVTQLHNRLVLLSPLAVLPLAFIGAFTLQPLVVSVDNYLRFLVMYGLAFPAYALLFMGRTAFERSGRNIWVFVFAVLVFAPLYEAGFLHGQAYLAALPPVVLVLWRLRRHISMSARAPQPEDRPVEPSP